MLVKVSTDKSVSDAAAALQAAVQAAPFGVMQVHKVREPMATTGVQFEREGLVFEVCRPVSKRPLADTFRGGQNKQVADMREAFLQRERGTDGTGLGCLFRE